MITFTTDQAYRFLTSLIDIEPSWTFRAAFVPFLGFLVAVTLGLFLLAYPPPRRYKKVCTVLLLIPLSIAFINHRDLLPWWRGCDTWARAMYIWWTHMSYEINIVEFEPKPEVFKENARLDWKIRLKQASKVFYTRSHGQASEANGTLPKKVASAEHGFSRTRFLLWQARKVALLCSAQYAWDAYQMAPVPRSYFDPNRAYFFRRMFSSPSSLQPMELGQRLEYLFDWTIISMFEYECFYSVFAIIWVGILRLDGPEEWPLNLCNSILEAWSVRRYWGKHWHDYIYISFSAHVKIVTRNWLRLEKRQWYTRLLENLLVFWASGLAHSLVRWKENPGPEKWCIMIYYMAQMVPMIFEGFVQDYWSKMRTRLGVKDDDKRVNTLEKMVGYAWVAGWFMWSIPKYIHTRNAWAWERLKKKGKVKRGGADAALKNETG